MIKVHAPTGDLEPAQAAMAGEATWIDLLRPDEGESAAVRAATGLDPPTFEQLSEVEVSSRLRRDGQALYLSLPLIFRDELGQPRTTPVGFILSASHLVTLRFEALKSFETCRGRLERKEVSRPTSVGIFVALLEAIVDRLADLLEEAGAELDAVAEEVFGRDLDDQPGRQPKAQDRRLRDILRRVGLTRQLVSKVRGTLLGIARIVPFVEAEDWLPASERPRLETVRHDVDSLDEYEVHLSDKVQFLLDADLGLINVEQNDRFRILTVVSIVGIPPVLIAGIYGMNFKSMPEYDWAYGYPFGLGLIALSALVPIVYFKVKGWF